MKKLFLTIALFSTSLILPTKYEALEESGQIIQGMGVVSTLSCWGLATSYVGFNALLEHELANNNHHPIGFLYNKTAWKNAIQGYSNSSLSRKSFMISGPLLYLVGKNIKDYGNFLQSLNKQ
jgi:hypothetical protein